jgi:lipoprotein-anchoring transpeptidase ErfK/SrfK
LFANENRDSSESRLAVDLAWQIALDRIGFSPGLIDGKIGPKTQLATREFQRVRGLPMTGRLDPQTAAALGVDPISALTTYTIPTEAAAQIGPVPRDWPAKSALPRLAYESMSAFIAEKFHCTVGLLGRLNPKLSLDALKPGDALTVPNCGEFAPTCMGTHLEINLTDKFVRVLDGQQRLLALFHCSVAAESVKLPSGRTRIASITKNPTYLFDPHMWPEVKGVSRKLLIPSGPRNPVGLCWIGLELPGYGIHGTPHPELIGKTGSHGCIRLTNWDALRLSRMIAVGAKVQFTS